MESHKTPAAVAAMKDEIGSCTSVSKAQLAVGLIEGFKKRLLKTDTPTQKIPFKALFTTVLVHLGRVLFQIVVTISGFFPTLVIASHIGGFILERWLEIICVDNNYLRLKKTTLTLIQIFILVSCCYFLDMVCALEENVAFCEIQDANNSDSVRAKFHFPASSTVADLYQEVGKIIQCHHDSFNLVLQNEKEDCTVLHQSKSDTVEMVGFKVGPDTKNTLVVVPSPNLDLSKGSSSPTASGDYETPVVPPPPPPLPPASTSSSGDYNCTSAIIRPEITYVGLVNQAMTCYLNSLLQALYMTPEFRNAIYNWEFDGSPNEESKSIPFQLQKLFLNLQTSKRSAVETTELTRSFGWDSWEAWQQHDIQELCRVMFDTLEQKFKNTKQADLINRLYEGKMIDYVKCLECSTEKSREDTFLDIPLPVRPFGSNITYGSVEEALRAFVQPETLDGNNQYHCDTCNKKCDAHKGLKFSKFPYLLTLHLKRFDFDCNKLHRIKLNDRVSFPKKLNLNSFIPQEKGSEINSESSPDETVIKCDDSCTTDSGSALDDEGCQGSDSVNMPNSHENHSNDYQEDDEGIDLEQQHENEKNRQISYQSGPYVYELFSIMIHSGSAAGGHYYAYIKDFKDGEWYCFNDQNVARITDDDIRKTYGGGPVMGYYSGVYSSSTNAYMLMYRQIDKERNASAMTVDEFPEHIKVLHKKLERQKELDDHRDLDCHDDLHSDSVTRGNGFHLCKLRVYCRPHPNKRTILETKVLISKECTLKQTVEEVYKNLNLEDIVPIERCRLVSYDILKDAIECSYEGREDYPIGKIFSALKHRNFLMDIRGENEEFVPYKRGFINTVVIVVNLESEDGSGISSPAIVRAHQSQTVKEYKETLSLALADSPSQLKLPEASVLIILEKLSNDPKLLLNDEATLKREGFYDNIKVFVATPLTSDDIELQKPHILYKFHKVLDMFDLVIALQLSLPEIDTETLERLNIVPIDQPQTTSHKPGEEPVLSNRSRGTSPKPRDSSPQPLPDLEDECVGLAGPQSDQSASEDSSLTDSERTIVGDAPGDGLAQLSPNSSPVGSDHNVSSSENESNESSTKRMDRFFSCVYNDNDSDIRKADETLSRNYYFEAVPYTEISSNQKMLKVFVDERMSQKTFKQCLEPYVGVPAQHFKICGMKNSELDYSIIPESLSFYKDNEKLAVVLDRGLKKGEYVGKVFLLTPSNKKEPTKHLFEWVIANGTPVSQVKKEILEKMKRKCAIEIPYERCRLRRRKLFIPLRPYLDGTTFDDLTPNWELLVQELPGEEPVKSPDQKLLMVQQFCSSTKELKLFEEVVLETDTLAELKEKISELSGIPAEFIETVKAPQWLPVFRPSLDLNWNPVMATDDSDFTYEEGDVIIYRDSRDKSKWILTKDRKQMKDRRNRLYSPVKERGLKIYLDATPPRKDESDVD